MKKTTEQCVVDLRDDKCYCRQFTFSVDKVGGEAGSAVEMPFMHCHRMIGFTDYEGVSTFFEEARSEIKSYVDQNKGSD